MKQTKRKHLLCQLIGVLLIFIVAYYVSMNWYQFLLIQGESMSPTYHSYQLVILDKKTRNYLRDEVIAFRCEKLSAVLVKRVIAVPGDEVQIVNQQLMVNGEQIDSYFFGKQIENAGLLSQRMVLEENQYLVLGDNLEKSVDSRSDQVGIVLGESIIGKVLY